MTHYVYLIECTDRYDSLYTGYTTDIERRLAAHNSGSGAKFTRGRTPVTLQYVEFWPSKSAAMRREWELKQRARSEKARLIPARSDRVHVDLDPAES